MFETLFSNMNTILDVIVNILQIIAIGLVIILVIDSIYDAIHKRRIRGKESAVAKAASAAVEHAAE